MNKISLRKTILPLFICFIVFISVIITAFVVGNALETEKYIYRNGYCDYVVVTPSSPTNYELAAVDEFVDLFKEATGYSFTVVKDNQTDGVKSYISLGNTAQFKASGISVSTEELGYSGYKIVTKEDNVFICGDTARNCPGTLYGVYGFMNKSFNFKQYSADCFHIDKTSRLKLNDWNLKDVPDIDMRSVGYLDLNKDVVYANRMRLQQWNGSTTSNEWVVNSHSQLEYMLRPQTYYEDHPDWYYSTNEGYSLCFTNQEVVEAMISRVKDELERNKTAEYLMLGQSDCSSPCQCNNCKARANSFGGSYSAVQLEFINKISDAVTPWLNQTQPGRKMTFYFFAYWWSLNPPGLNSNGQRYITCRDNVGVMWTPLSMNYKYDICNTVNSNYRSSLDGWCECTKNLTIYYYPISFKHYLINFNDFGSMEENIRYVVSKGCKYYYTQANGNDTRGAALQDLRTFVVSQLLWDSSLHYEDLVKEFILNYFADASTAMQKYYDVTRTWYTIGGEAVKDTGLTGADWCNMDAFPKDLVDSLDMILDDALKAIEKYKTTDFAVYEKLYWRIEKERLTTTFIDLQLYSSYYSKGVLYEKATHFKDTIEHFNITSMGEGAISISDFVAQFS